MKTEDSSQRTNRAFGGTAVSIVTHVFGVLTCTTCWAIFAPALALMFGSAGVAALAALRPLAPYALIVSAAGLTYSIYQLVGARSQAKKLPYRMAATFTALSLVGWLTSAAYVVTTFIVG
jgi:hypothetical protein